MHLSKPSLVRTLVSMLVTVGAQNTTLKHVWYQAFKPNPSPAGGFPGSPVRVGLGTALGTEDSSASFSRDAFVAANRSAGLSEASQSQPRLAVSWEQLKTCPQLGFSEDFQRLLTDAACPVGTMVKLAE